VPLSINKKPALTAVTGAIKDVLQHRRARLTQHLRLSVGTVNSPLDVLEFRLEQAFNETYVADITVASTDKPIDGAGCVRRRASFMVEESRGTVSVWPGRSGGRACAASAWRGHPVGTREGEPRRGNLQAAHR